MFINNDFLNFLYNEKIIDDYCYVKCQFILLRTISYPVEKILECIDDLDTKNKFIQKIHSSSFSNYLSLCSVGSKDYEIMKQVFSECGINYLDIKNFLSRQVSLFQVINQIRPIPANVYLEILDRYKKTRTTLNSEKETPGVDVIDKIVLPEANEDLMNDFVNYLHELKEKLRVKKYLFEYKYIIELEKTLVTLLERGIEILEIWMIDMRQNIESDLDLIQKLINKNTTIDDYTKNYDNQKKIWLPAIKTIMID